VVFRVNPDPSAENPDQEILHHCGGRAFTTTRQYCPAWT
jgi:hypothetical protein